MTEHSMEEMKRVIGHNIVALRRGAGLTQSELAERLNYSDKAVSKWECGDAVPDILILTRITEMFGVTLDWLVKSEHEVNMPRQVDPRWRRRTVIMLLSTVLVWLIGSVVFVLLGGFSPGTQDAWLSFIVSIPVSALTFCILAAVWHRRIAKYTSMSIFLWGTLLSIFLILQVHFTDVFSSPWLLFIIGIPLQVAILLWPLLFEGRKKNRVSTEETPTK